ncbi:MAG: hypothetical protein EXQ83_07840 [Xanthobacteraceae bacterium]|nr:hypothetical protein [Xanthobacteraceae bacterium]
MRYTTRIECVHSLINTRKEFFISTLDRSYSDTSRDPDLSHTLDRNENVGARRSNGKLGADRRNVEHRSLDAKAADIKS